MASGKGRLGTEMGAHVGRGDVGVGEAWHRGGMVLLTFYNQINNESLFW